jgi:hypothetical protein
MYQWLQNREALLEKSLQSETGELLDISSKNINLSVFY